MCFWCPALQLGQLFKTEHLKEHFEQLDALLAQKERDNKLDAMRPAAPVSNSGALLQP